jgi:hypothetical protein
MGQLVPLRSGCGHQVLGPGLGEDGRESRRVVVRVSLAVVDPIDDSQYGPCNQSDPRECQP